MKNQKKKLTLAYHIVNYFFLDLVHPPAGAFAYIAVNASAKIRSLGYFYMILPVGIGSIWFVLWAWMINEYINKFVEILFGTKEEAVEELELKNGRDRKTETGITPISCGHLSECHFTGKSTQTRNIVSALVYL